MKRECIAVFVILSALSAAFANADTIGPTGTEKTPEEIMNSRSSDCRNSGGACGCDSCAELRRESHTMPDNISDRLEQILLPSDYGVISADREKAREVLSAVSYGSYGYAERKGVERLLDAETYPVTPEEMIGFRRVRSIQIDARGGIFSYPYFNCRFRKIGDKVFFEKTSGSQRKSGYLYQNSPESLIFLGGWSVNSDPQTEYGSKNSVAGTVYRIGPGKAIMIFPAEDGRVEIYELRK